MVYAVNCIKFWQYKDFDGSPQFSSLSTCTAQQPESGSVGTALKNNCLSFQLNTFHAEEKNQGYLPAFTVLELVSDNIESNITTVIFFKRFCTIKFLIEHKNSSSPTSRLIQHLSSDVSSPQVCLNTIS